MWWNDTGADTIYIDGDHPTKADKLPARTAVDTTTGRRTRPRSKHCGCELCMAKSLFIEQV